MYDLAVCRCLCKTSIKCGDVIMYMSVVKELPQPSTGWARLGLMN
jgi:hypothetical protein